MNPASFRAILVLTATTSGFNNTINNSLSNAQARLNQFAARSQAIGKDMMIGGGVIAAPFVVGAKAAIDYEEAFAGVAKTWRGSEDALMNVSEGILAMSGSQLNTSTANELARIAEQGNQLGIQGQNILGFTRIIADLGATTNLGEDAAQQFAQFANITQMSQSNFDRLGSTVVALGNNMATTEKDIVAFGMRIAGAGAQVDIPQSKIMGLAAGLSSVGLEAEAGGTAISKTLIQLSNRTKTGGAALEDVARIAGMSGAAFKKAFETDAATATVTFIEGLGKIKKQGGNVFGVLERLGMDEVRLRDALLRASGAGDLLRRSIMLSSEAWDENSALTDEAGKRYATTGSQLKQFKNNLTLLAITTGNALVPAIQAMSDGLKDMTMWIRDAAEKHPDLTKAVVMGTAALGAFLVVGGAVAYTIGTISKIASTMSTVMSVLGNTTKVLTALQWLWNIAMAANPIGAVIVAVVALGAAVAALVVYWDDLGRMFSEAPTWAKVVITVFAAINAPILAIIGAIAFLIKNWDDLPGAIGRAVTKAGQWVMSLLPKVAGVVGKIIGFVVTLPIQIPMLIGKAVMAAGSALLAAAPALWQAAKDTFNGIVDFVASIPGRMLEAGKNIVNSLVDGMISVARAPVDFISGLAEDIMSYLPFSPAKQGPFKRIMDVQIVESIAKGMRPQPMVSAMQQAAGATMSVAAGGSPGTATGAPVAAPARRGGGGVTVNFNPRVTIEGHADPEQIMSVIRKMVPEVVAAIKRGLANEQRVDFGAG